MCLTVTYIHEKHSKAIATCKQSYNYLLFGFASFSQSFSDVIQNIMSTTYKGQVGESRGGVEGWAVGSGYLSDTMGPVVCQRSHQ